MGVEYFAQVVAPIINAFAALMQRLGLHPAAPLLGSSLREATGFAPVTKIVSQCDRQK